MVAIGLTIGWIFQSADGPTAEVGEQAPNFTVELIDGGTFSLSEALGRTVVLNFWASWCGPCREEIPAISVFADANPDVAVVGVAVRDVEEASRQFAAEVDASYPLALGTDEVEEAYPAFGLPYTVIIDAEGTVEQIYEGVVDQYLLDDLVG